MQTCEYPSYRFGAGNVDRVCGGKYRWTRDKIDGNPYFLFAKQRQISFSDGNRQKNRIVSTSIVQYTKLFPEKPIYSFINCFGYNEHEKWPMSCF